MIQNRMLAGTSWFTRSNFRSSSTLSNAAWVSGKRWTLLNAPLSSEDDCADVLMLLANVRGGVNSLMAEVLEDHIRLHMLSPKKSPISHTALAEDFIDLVRAYLK